jgi:3-dehydro-L-gulonate 2-dehydrogenase
MKNFRIPYKEMQTVFHRILVKHGFTDEKANQCAQIFAENSLEGVASHGVNRFPRFVDYIKKGYINVQKEPQLIHSAGALEQWDGQLGPGPINAIVCTDRAMHLAKKNGLGCAALANTNHWMRGGTYGWQAAREGFAFIGWTNTEANMPVWGAKDSRLGNNPLVLAVPYKSEAVVLDFAMTQYSYGKMETARLEGNSLPYAGGFDESGKLTIQPGEVLKSRRALPVGYWKGAGLSLLLDIMASILSAGLPTFKISRNEAEYAVSQVFIAFSLENLSNYPAIETTINEIIMDYKDSASDENEGIIRYPGERISKVRTENLEHGIPVIAGIWEEVVSL